MRGPKGDKQKLPANDANLRELRLQLSILLTGSIISEDWEFFGPAIKRTGQYSGGERWQPDGRAESGAKPSRTRDAPRVRPVPRLIQAAGSAISPAELLLYDSGKRYRGSSKR